MHILKELDRRDLQEIGRELHRFAAELYPICRSITGDGIRRTFALIQSRIKLQISEVSTGTPVFEGVELWGTDDGDTVVWGTSCNDPSCQPVVWNRP